ncbi:hypothetical protein PX701_11545 [Agromyces sp. H3Y2-19a]|uniref:hypothetical protein n=1 Tax=Agromyces chromiiresistens TaxID=3030835 RepID=UPI0023B9D715|nr:hypothetical protein [Agromyces chromiiresistens]MDF0514256.1 hypothetical protein [Agromyces chromiiresistens]
MPPREPAVRLLAALRTGDDVALTACLHRDVRLVVDTGDETGGELVGRGGVVRALVERLTNGVDASLEASQVNGCPGLVLRQVDGEVIGVLGVDGGDAIDGLWLSTAPSKLAHWNGRPTVR